MKKVVHQRLNNLAEKLPLVFEEKEGFVDMTGDELMLTPYGDYQKYDKDKIYKVPVPEYHAVEHKQQLKDALKRGGIKAVQDYCNKIIKDVESGTLIQISNLQG